MSICRVHVCAAAVLLMGTLPVSADVIARAVSTANFNSTFTQIDPDYSIAGDMFGIRSTSSPGPDGLPFAIEDVGGTDNQGIIKNKVTDPAVIDTAPFFGVVDTVNGTGNDANVASWTFDISAAAGDLAIAIDFAAMGDFEGSNADYYNFDYSIDGSAYLPLFTSSVDEAGQLTYQLLGTSPTLQDPLYMNGTLLNNEFQTLSAAIGSLGAELTLRFTGLSDGGTEAFAFRNIAVSATVPEASSLTLLGLVVAGAGGTLVRRRLRKIDA